MFLFFLNLKILYGKNLTDIQEKKFVYNVLGIEKNSVKYSMINLNFDCQHFLKFRLNLIFTTKFINIASGYNGLMVIPINFINRQRFDSKFYRSILK